jgi:hypothetical protein
MLISVEGPQILKEVGARMTEDLARRADSSQSRDEKVIRKIVEALLEETDSTEFHIALRRTRDPIAIMIAFELLAPARWRRRTGDQIVCEVIGHLQIEDEALPLQDLFVRLFRIVTWPWLVRRDRRVANLRARSSDFNRRQLMRTFLECSTRSQRSRALECQHLFSQDEFNMLSDAVNERVHAA